VNNLESYSSEPSRDMNTRTLSDLVILFACMSTIFHYKGHQSNKNYNFDKWFVIIDLYSFKIMYVKNNVSSRISKMLLLLFLLKKENNTNRNITFFIIVNDIKFILISIKVILNYE